MIPRRIKRWLWIALAITGVLAGVFFGRGILDRDKPAATVPTLRSVVPTTTPSVPWYVTFESPDQLSIVGTWPNACPNLSFSYSHSYSYQQPHFIEGTISSRATDCEAVPSRWTVTVKLRDLPPPDMSGQVIYISIDLRDIETGEHGVRAGGAIPLPSEEDVA